MYHSTALSGVRVWNYRDWEAASSVDKLKRALLTSFCILQILDIRLDHCCLRQRGSLRRGIILEKCMKTEDLLRATRDVYLLVPRPGQSTSENLKFWSMPLKGLHGIFLKESVVSLRQQQESRGVTVSKVKSLKSTELYQSLAMTLGARSYEHWRAVESKRILGFLAENGMTRPADLIKWSYPPGFSGALTAGRLADRFFNSGLPLPKRLFTGVGSLLFAASGYGRMDIQELAGRYMYEDEERLEYCELHANEVILRAHHLKGSGGPEFLDLTGRMLLLNAISEGVGCSYNLLGDNLSDPRGSEPVLTLYKASDKELDFDRRLFHIFRTEIERSDDGWVEVLPLPGNDNIIFLKGLDGAFDWVIRDQRDKPFMANPLSPMFKSNELPSAMQNPKLDAHLYFRAGESRERLEHDAEHRYYAEGGSPANWPGYDKLLMRELVAGRGYAPPRPMYGQASMHFVSHRLNDQCLMISPLITIDEFWRFYEDSEWRRTRQDRAKKAKRDMKEHLSAVNLGDPGHLPVSVTWFDSIAFCRHYELQTGLPVRLLAVDEWKQISPVPLRDIEKDGWGDLTWRVTGGDGLTGGESTHRYKEGGVLHFRGDLSWSLNSAGLPFLSIVDFGEWLADYHSGYAPVANAATGKALMTGPLERDKCLAASTMQYKGLKVGFRICYVAQPDA